jgi:hypothetical protein
MAFETFTGYGTVKVREAAAPMIQFEVRTVDGNFAGAKTAAIRMPMESKVQLDDRITLDMKPDLFLVGSVIGVTLPGASRVGDRLLANSNLFDVKANWIGLETSR